MTKKRETQRQECIKNNNTIRIGSKHKGKHVYVKDIIYIQASENYTFIHLQNGGRILSSKCLKHYESLLTSIGFIRIHRSFLVHLIHIKEYEGKYRLLHLSDQNILSVSYRKKTSISKIINNQVFPQATQEVA